MKVTEMVEPLWWLLDERGTQKLEQWV